MHSDGITLTKNSRSWVSVANPLRTDTIADHTLAHDTPQLGRLQGLIPALCGGAVTLTSVLAGAHPLLAIALGLAVLVLVLAILMRRSVTQWDNRRASLLARSEGLGPRRIARGTFLPGARATAADSVVMGTTRILKSKAFRSGALGEPENAYADLMELTWDLVWKLQIVERETRTITKLKQGKTADRGTVDSLQSALGQAWDHQIEPAVIAHRELADAVDDLDLVLDNSGDVVRADDVDVRAGRAATAMELARRGLDHPPGYLPELTEHSADCDDTPTH